MNSVTKIALAIVGVAMAATLVVNYKGTSSVVGSVSSGFAQALTAAEKG